MRTTIIAFIVLVSLVPIRAEQWPASTRILSYKAGLSQGSVRQIVQDGKGFVWLATFDGLHRFDGNELVYFGMTPGKTGGLRGNEVRAFANADRDHLWLATYTGGLHRFNVNTGSAEIYQQYDLSSLADVVEFAQFNGELRMAKGNHLYTWHANRWTLTKTYSNNIIKLKADQAGSTLIVSTRDHSELFSGGLEAPAAVFPFTVNALLRIHEQWWLGTTKGVRCFAMTQEVMSPCRLPAALDDVSQFQITALLTNKEMSRVWVGTLGFGVVEFTFAAPTQTQHWRSNAATSQLPSADVLALYSDRLGSIWIGTDRGVAILNPAADVFKRYAFHEGQKDNLLSIRSMTQDQRGDIWLGTNSNLLRLDSNWRIKNRIEARAFNVTGAAKIEVHAIVSAADSIYVGTEHGLAQLKVTEKKTEFVHSWLNAMHVTALHAVDSTTLLAGTYGKGIIEIQLGKGADSQLREIATHDPYVSMIKRFDETLWIGGFTQGAVRLTGADGDAVLFATEEVERQLSHNNVSDVMPWNGSWLIATAGGGLNVVAADDRLTYITTEQGLASNTIYAIKTDANADIWLSTNRGLSRLSQDLSTLTNFGEDDGILGQEFNANSALQHANGELYFGGVYGVTSTPNLALLPYIKPTIALLHPRQGGQALSFQAANQLASDFHAGTLTLLAEQGDLDVLLATDYLGSGEPFVLDVSATNGQLNFERDSGLLHIKQNNQDPFTVSIRVKNRLTGELIGTSAASIEFLPPWHKTQWAKALFATGLFIMTFGLAGYYKRQWAKQQTVNERLQSLDRLKDEFISKLSQLLRSPIQHLTDLSDFVEQDHSACIEPRVRKRLMLIHESSKQLNRVVDHLLDLSRLQHGLIHIASHEFAIQPVLAESISAIKLIHRDCTIQLNKCNEDCTKVLGDESYLGRVFTQVINFIISEHAAVLIEVGMLVDEKSVVIELSSSQDDVLGQDKHQKKSEIDLSLPLCQSLIRRMGGDFQFKVSDGGSVKLSISLLKAAENTPPLETADNGEVEIRESGNLPPANILIANDDVIECRVLASCLSAYGYHVNFVYDGMNVISAIQQHKPDVVLLDAVLPKLDGLAVCQRIRESFDVFALPVLILSDSDEAEKLMAALASGANDYLKKPIRSNELLARLRTLLTMHYVNELRRQKDLVLDKANAMMRLSLHRAQLDATTGLPNRHYMQHRLAGMLQSESHLNTHLAIVLISIESLSTINESFGIEAGELSMNTLATRVRDIVRERDLVCRWSVDQLLVIFAQLDQRAIDSGVSWRLASNVQHVLQQPIMIGDTELECATTIGLVEYPKDGRTGPTILRRVESAVRHARQKGSGSICAFEEKMDITASQQHAMRFALAQAVKKQGLHVHYQLQWDINSNAFCAAEALVRWKDERFGAVSPAEFIPIAESAGLIVSIGQFVLRQSCADMRRWLDLGLGIRHVAVNVSIHQLLDENLITSLSEYLHEFHLLPEHIELEITESALSQDIDHCIEVMRLLRDMGIRLSIDDFGTGYSSLAYLRKFPLHVLKIDQSFVRGIPDVDMDVAIVQAIVQMAKALQLDVVAEGVETPEQLHFLQTLGVQVAQGYLLAKPANAEHVVEALQLRRCG